jgi:hypothetical protein
LPGGLSLGAHTHHTAYGRRMMQLNARDDALSALINQHCIKDLIDQEPLFLKP